MSWRAFLIRFGARDFNAQLVVAVVIVVVAGAIKLLLVVVHPR